ncbi:hypothetical protein [Amycolatopsis albispora]|uniref:Uncharacterized protein n=1 Tax=Amycolatopsis albispora TaxID=1804986 RepID=A0A344L299_9PSEU|nr:hypothetical protein [Amycolatopsis albispora]AXB42173.1 hypothetical protein A4R43_06195 [Amycolatopsis albispora]
MDSVDRKENLSTQDLLPGEQDTTDRTAQTAQSDVDIVDPEPTETTSADDEQHQPLFAPEEVDGYREQWKSIQINFVDDPQRAVREADELVAKVIQSLAATFAAHKSELEGQWSRGGEVATEDLRLALRQYRSFFHQLLSA